MQVFQSATIKLTAWYLAIIMFISISFSVVIFQLSYSEVSSRLENLQHSLVDNPNNLITGGSFYQSISDKVVKSELSKAASQMLLSLFYLNLVVFLAGGLGSYFLARLSLKPIEEVHEAQSRFTSDASHELRTPLAAMKTELEVTLRAPKLTEKDAKETLTSNLEEVNKLIDLSEMLLRLSKLEHESITMKRIDIVRLVKTILNKDFKKYSTRFLLETRQSSYIYANQAAIRELINILIDNAVKYSPAKSPIKVRIFHKNNQACIAITNQGEPIAKELQSKIFLRFYRADTSRTGGHKRGYGLGLSIAKRIADMHRGSIDLLSNQNGTTFTFRTPLQKTK